MEFFEKDFGKILKHSALEQRRAFNKTDSNCGRVYDRNLVQIPVTVDLYANYARITDYSEDGLSDEMAGMVSDICRRMLYIEGDKVILQRRPRRVGREQHEKQDSEPLYVDVRENGMTFKVDLTSHVDTGLFLDQVNNRKMVMEQSLGRDVLNLFSYTGSFSVYAAKGGARSVTSVDMSNTYTAWAEDNLKSNGFAGEMYRCVCQDARAFVAEAIKKKDKYDIIIFDPPCFSNSRKMNYDFDVQRDYVRWLTGLCSIMRKGGFILFSTNLATFGFDGSLKRRNKVKEITAQTKAQGFTCRVGSARSWILEKDEEKLTLDWDDSAAEKPVKKSARKKAQPKVDAAKEKKEPVEADAAENKEAEEIIQAEPVERKESDAVESAVAEVSETACAAAAPEDDAAASEEDAKTPEDDAELPDDSEELPELEEPVLDGSYLSDDEGVEEEASDESVEEASEDSGFGMNEWREGDEDSKHSHRDSIERKDRRDSSRDRSDRPAHRDRDDRDRGFGRRDSFRDRSDRPSYRDRDDRDRGFGRRDSFRDRSDRPSFHDRDDKERRFRFDRDDSFRDRDRRSSRFDDRDDRDRNRDRGYDRRGSYGERTEDSPFGSRFSRSSYRDRDDRGGYGAGRENDRRDSFRDRFDRPSFRDRSDRPSYRGRDERDSRDRGSFRKDSRKPYGFDSFKPARDRNDSKQFFWLDDEDDKKDK